MKGKKVAWLLVLFVLATVAGFLLGGGWLFMSGFCTATVLFVSLGKWVEKDRKQVLNKLMADGMAAMLANRNKEPA